MNYDRKNLYNLIKKYNLQDKIKDSCGKNYTVVSSQVLSNFVKSHEAGVETNDNSKLNNKAKETPVVPKEPVVIKSETSRLDKLIGILANKHILLKSEIEFINS